MLVTAGSQSTDEIREWSTRPVERGKREAKKEKGGEGEGGGGDVPQSNFNSNGLINRIWALAPMGRS
jgi:hypothetical protein